MNRSSWIRLLIILTVFFLVYSSRAQTEPYRPLVIGYYWEYYWDNLDEYERQQVVRKDTIFGEMVYAVYYDPSPNDQGLENYWSNEEDGSLLLWGFHREEDGGWGYLYNPPITVLDTPLFVGKSWACTTSYYSTQDTAYCGTYEMIFHVVADTLISVPAGDFQTFCISYEIVSSANADFELDKLFPSQDGSERFHTASGRDVMGKTIEAQQELSNLTWYFRGIGEIQFASGYAKLSDFSVQTDAHAVPKIEQPILYQNYPNPFNPSTNIEFYLCEPARVSITIYDAGGSIVRRLIDRSYGIGNHAVQWDGRNDAGSTVSSGVYFCRLCSSGSDEMKKMILLR